MRLTELEFNALLAARRGESASPIKTASSEAIRQSRRQPNATERRFEIERLLPWQATGEIAGYQYEALALRLGNGVRFTPDFFTYGPDGVRIFEVKGGFVREDAAVKLKVAAAQFECFEFYLAQYRKGEWSIQRILA